MLRRPRLLYLALSLLFLHMVAAAVMKQSLAGRIVSNSIELAIGVTAAASCFQAGMRSRYLARSFWLLSSCSFGLWSVAQLCDTVLERVLHVPMQPSIHLLSFLAFVPMLVSVFIFDYRADETIRVEVLLDALQLTILIVSAYAFFIIIPGAQNGSDSTTKLGLSLLHIRNILLAAGLMGRALFTQSTSRSRLFAPMAAAMSLFAVTSWSGNHIQEVSVVFGHSYWLQLCWSIPFALVAVIATEWHEEPEGAPAGWKKQRISTLLLVYGPCVFFPIALYIKVATVSQAQIFVGLGTVLISLVLYTLRLALLQSRQNEMMGTLADTAERYQSLFERNMAGVYRSTLGGRLVDFNPAFAQMFGYTREELLNLPRGELFADGAEERARRVEEHKRNSLGQRLEVEYLRKDRRPLWVIQEESIVVDETGCEVIEGTMLDITDRHFLEIQLRQAQKMEAVGRLAGGVAHDFNNLLTIVISYSEMLVLNSAPGTVVSNYAEQIKGAGKRAASLTRQLLAFSRQQVLQPQIVNLNSILVNLEKMLLRLIGEHIHINTLMAPDLGNVRADMGQIEQVVMNLVLNARDAMLQGGTLTLVTENLELTEGFVSTHHEVKPGHYVQLTISDTGLGMDAETLSHIFEPFFTTKEQGKGTGLGLATVYGIVKQSGGYIWAYSESGCGATFKIFLPRVDNLPLTPELERLNGEEYRGSETILVVEDDHALRDLTKAILAARGYRVVTATEPEEVDTVCENLGGSIDLLLTDVVMPVMGGREIASRVVKRCPKVKVLYMSGYAPYASGHPGILDPNVVFLQKPFTPSTLTAKVREALESSSTN